jgi:DNA ligase-1
LRWDKPPREADRLESLEKLLKTDAAKDLAKDFVTSADH